MTNARHNSVKWRARSHGQVIALGAVTLFTMALMLMATFSLTNAVHEKIRVQSTADAVAYSLATVEARAFNVTAHYNRAIAADLVAQMSVHSYMAICTADVAMLKAGVWIMFFIFLEELSQVSWVPSTWVHIWHAIAALRSMRNFNSAGNDWADKLSNLEDTFNDSVDALKTMNDSLYSTQNFTLQMTRAELSGLASVGSAVTKANAKQGNVAVALASKNISSFTCALEGSRLDGSSCSGRSKASKSNRSKIMQNVANSSRPQFDEANYLPYLDEGTDFLPFSGDAFSDALNNNGTFLYYFYTKARVSASQSTSNDKGDEAKVVGAASPLGIASVLNFYDSSMVWFFSANIYSDKDGGKHGGFMFPSSGHSGNHDKFQGVEHPDESDPCGQDNCFVNFRATSDSGQDFGFPTVLSGFSQDLNLRHTNGDTNKNQSFTDKSPWDINDSKKIKIKLTSREETVDLRARGTGHAVAKAKVYYHQLGDWKAPPNFFDPFWRPKLHYFSKADMRTTAALAGDANGAAMLLMGAPAEGGDK
jgi:hypothetical protein